ncbi:HK97-gp10 family putative phage morphogenesis protein [Parafrankia discariae]|uniref:HK97-gp10 family putative phage morphogenesis protein n=1 Tax=Parafrankia discariae TaxID=365528 RepID=UPI00035F9383|nr:HK97-gp10 family putative phage morphogenesis protein [Parafrankia discariae]
MARRGQAVRIEGLKELRDAIGRIEGQVLRGIRRAVEQSVEAVQADAERRAPVRTGDLQQVGIGSQVDGDGLGGDVGFTGDGFYGHFVEFGTSHSPAQPMLGPAAEAERAELPRRMTREISRELGA